MKVNQVRPTLFLCQNLPELAFVRTVRVGSAEPTRRLGPSNDSMSVPIVRILAIFGAHGRTKRGLPVPKTVLIQGPGVLYVQNKDNGLINEFSTIFFLQKSK